MEIWLLTSQVLLLTGAIVILATIAIVSHLGRSRDAP